jgi:hypothetical protein
MKATIVPKHMIARKELAHQDVVCEVLILLEQPRIIWSPPTVVHNGVGIFAGKHHAPLHKLVVALVGAWTHAVAAHGFG